MDDGFQIATDFAALAFLWIFAAQFLFITISWTRRLLG
jgi:hypothetical protein